MLESNVPPFSHPSLLPVLNILKVATLSVVSLGFIVSLVTASIFLTVIVPTSVLDGFVTVILTVAF
mgnify:CR=1 FL=1